MPGARRGFHPLTVVEVVEETADARSYVLEVPAELRPHFAYRAGQYLTFRLPAPGGAVLRCYSMSSSPDLAEPLRTTVKRVPGGVGSNWLIDTVRAGDVLEATTPAGTFLLVDEPGPLVTFAGGSGITPVLSIVKSALATTARPVRLLYANRDRDSVILAGELEALAAAHRDRFTVVHHLDAERGFATPADVHRFLDGATGVHVMLCGPTGFMDLVEAALAEAGVPPDLVRSERFVQPEPPAGPGDAAAGEAPGAGTTVVITLGGSTRELTWREGETVLDTARRAGMDPPFSCQAGNCATCMARLAEGEVRMRVNDALDPDEVADGWILTCQALPTTPLVRVRYED